MGPHKHLDVTASLDEGILGCIGVGGGGRGARGGGRGCLIYPSAGAKMIPL